MTTKRLLIIAVALALAEVVAAQAAVTVMVPMTTNGVVLVPAFAFTNNLLTTTNGALLQTGSQNLTNWSGIATNLVAWSSGGVATNLYVVGGINMDSNQPAPAWQEGKVFYDTGQHTLAYYNDNTNMTLNVGAEETVRVRNRSGSTISDGSAVYISGAQGQLPTISLALGGVSGYRSIGITTVDMNDGDFGYVTTGGLVNGLNTSAFVDGAVLYPSTNSPGGFQTNSYPGATQIGYVAYSHNNQGKILVNVVPNAVMAVGQTNWPASSITNQLQPSQIAGTLTNDTSGTAAFADNATYATEAGAASTADSATYVINSAVATPDAYLSGAANLVDENGDVVQWAIGGTFNGSLWTNLSATNIVGTLTNNTTGSAASGWPTQWPLSSITNAAHLTNWAALSTNVIPRSQTNISYTAVTNAPWLTTVSNVAYATNASFAAVGTPDFRATNIGGSISITNSAPGSAPLVQASNYMASTPAIRIATNGSVGLGTAASRPLELMASSINPVGWLGGPNQFWIMDSQPFGTNSGGGIGLGGYYDAALNQVIFGAIAGTKENATSGNYAGTLRFFTVFNNQPVLSQSSERMRITSTGLVGIGTTAPQSLLHVSGNITAAGLDVSGTATASGLNVSNAISTVGSVYPSGPAAMVVHAGGTNTGMTVTGTNTYAAALTVTNGFTLLTPVWKDYVTSPTVLSRAGSATTREAITPLQPQITVEGWPVGAYGDGEMQVNHDAAATNSAFPNFYISAHLHVSCTNVTASLTNSAWVLYWNWSQISGSLATAAAGTNYVTNVFGANWRHDLVAFANITNNAVSGTISSIFHYRLQRINSGAGDVGDSTGIVRLHDFDIHYGVNKLGSSGPATY